MWYVIKAQNHHWAVSSAQNGCTLFFTVSTTVPLCPFNSCLHCPLNNYQLLPPRARQGRTSTWCSSPPTCSCSVSPTVSLPSSTRWGTSPNLGINVHHSLLLGEAAAFWPERLPSWCWDRGYQEHLWNIRQSRSDELRAECLLLISQVLWSRR